MKKIILLLLLSISLTLHGQDMNNIQTAFSQSYTYETDSNYEASIAALQNIYDANSYLINCRLGWLYYLNSEYDQSLSYYEKANTLMPYALEAQIGAAYPLGAMGNWNAVIVNYEKILKIDPQNALINYRLGLVLYNQGRYKEAFPFVERVANLYPFDYYSVVLLGWIQLKMGRLREAGILFEKALQIKPQDESALEGLAESGMMKK